MPPTKLINKCFTHSHLRRSQGMGSEIMKAKKEMPFVPITSFDRQNYNMLHMPMPMPMPTPSPPATSRQVLAGQNVLFVSCILDDCNQRWPDGQRFSFQRVAIEVALLFRRTPTTRYMKDQAVPGDSCRCRRSRCLRRGSRETRRANPPSRC